jgi:hypothetical protein
MNTIVLLLRIYLYLIHDIKHLIKFSFNTPKFNRGLDTLSDTLQPEVGIKLLMSHGSRKGHAAI